MWHDAVQRCKHKNLIYGSMALSSAVQCWSGDPQLTDMVQPNNLTGMHIISQSMCLHRQNAAVISTGDIVHGCHLMGKSGLKIDPSWTMDNVLNLTTHFYLNPYINVDSFMSYNF